MAYTRACDARACPPSHTARTLEAEQTHVLRTPGPSFRLEPPCWPPAMLLAVELQLPIAPQSAPMDHPCHPQGPCALPCSVTFYGWMVSDCWYPVPQDSPATNAGLGSCLNLEGRVECDAALMGGGGEYGAVGAVAGGLAAGRDSWGAGMAPGGLVRLAGRSDGWERAHVSLTLAYRLIRNAGLGVRPMQVLHALLGVIWLRALSGATTQSIRTGSRHACTYGAPSMMAVPCCPGPFAALLQACPTPSWLRRPWHGTRPHP